MNLPVMATKVKKNNLTYLSEAKLESLYDCIYKIKNKHVFGNFLEFGVALGGSALCFASELDQNRRFLGFDVFGMIPPPSERDGDLPKSRYEIIRSGKSSGIGDNNYYGYNKNLYQLVSENFLIEGMPVDGHRIQLVKGLFEDTLPHTLRESVAVAHIDCDWYDPVLYCLYYTFPLLSSGGFIIVDDYNDWPGCRKATDDFCLATPEAEFLYKEPHAVLTKR